MIYHQYIRYFQPCLFYVQKLSHTVEDNSLNGGDDAFFFNRDWAGACRGRWAGPGLLAGWAAGSWIVWVEVGSGNAGLQALDVALLCKNKKEGGSARASPVAAPMPKSVSF